MLHSTHNTFSERETDWQKNGHLVSIWTVRHLVRWLTLHLRLQNADFSWFCLFRLAWQTQQWGTVKYWNNHVGLSGQPNEHSRFRGGRKTPVFSRSQCSSGHVLWMKSILTWSKMLQIGVKFACSNDTAWAFVHWRKGMGLHQPTHRVRNILWAGRHASKANERARQVLCPGPLWSILVIDWNMGLIACVWGLPKCSFYAYTNFALLRNGQSQRFIPIGSILKNSLLSTCYSGHLKWTLWRHFVSYQNKTFHSTLMGTPILRPLTFFETDLGLVE